MGLQVGNNDLRAWQQEALARTAGDGQDVLVEACPGAGKTRFALRMARIGLDSGEFDQIIIVVPTTELRTQLGEAASRYEGIQIDYGFSNGELLWSSSFQGAVTTYAAVAREPEKWAVRTRRRRTLVILDEIHHAGERENLTWGPGLRTAFGDAVRRLLLSGTPFRTDGARIPWVRYDIDGLAQPNYRYVYRQGVADRVVRPIRFDKLDSSVEWLEDVQHRVRLGEAVGDQESKALRTALHPGGAWMRTAIGTMDGILTAIRRSIPGAGMLLVAKDRSSADQIAKVVQRTTGEVPVVVHGDSEEAIGGIERFRNGTQRWIVAVQMVSEGVDIPRIVGGIYATNRLTDLAFRQIVLRAGRVMGPDDRTAAVWAIPPIPRLVALAHRMESEANAGLNDDDDDEPVRMGEGAPRTPSLFVPLGSGDAVRTGAIFRGEHLADEELAEAEALIASSGSSAQPTEVILLLRDMKARGVIDGPAPPLQPDPPTAAAVDAPDVFEQVPLKVKHLAMRREIKAKVGQMRHRTGAEYSDIHRWLNQAVGEYRIEAATTETLERRLGLLTDPAVWPWEDRWQGPPRDMW